MILELILSPFVYFISFIISLIPNMPTAPPSLITTINFIKKAGWCFDRRLFMFIITTFIAFSTLQLAWAVVEWIYKKIPGIN